MYSSMKIGKATLDEESHHIWLQSEKYKTFIIDENKSLSKLELAQKYNIDLTKFPSKSNDGFVQIGLVYFQYENGKLVNIE